MSNIVYKQFELLCSTYNYEDDNILDLIKTNPKKYSFPYIILELFSRYQFFNNSRSTKNTTNITNIYGLDSLVYQKNYVFILHRTGILDDFQLKVYNLWFDFFEEHFNNSSLFLRGFDDISFVDLTSIDGNISAGKSTVLEELKLLNEDKIKIVDEPLDDWINIKNSEGKDILSAFYEDNSKYAFTFQILALFTRFKSLIDCYKKAEILYKNTNKKTIILIERTLFTDYYVFAKMLFDSSIMNDIEIKVYKSWFDVFSSEFPITRCIYIRTTPEICYERLLIRNRNGECNISIEYLKNCHDQHEFFYENLLKFCNCKIICGNEENITETYKTKIKLILDYIIMG